MCCWRPARPRRLDSYLTLNPSLSAVAVKYRCLSTRRVGVVSDCIHALPVLRTDERAQSCSYWRQGRRASVSTTDKLPLQRLFRMMRHTPARKRMSVCAALHLGWVRKRMNHVMSCCVCVHAACGAVTHAEKSACHPDVTRWRSCFIVVLGSHSF
jgi:hypothetical protein